MDISLQMVKVDFHWEYFSARIFSPRRGNGFFISRKKRAQEENLLFQKQQIFRLSTATTFTTKSSSELPPKKGRDFSSRFGFLLILGTTGHISCLAYVLYQFMTSRSYTVNLVWFQISFINKLGKLSWLTKYRESERKYRVFRGNTKQVNSIIMLFLYEFSSSITYSKIVF